MRRAEATCSAAGCAVPSAEARPILFYFGTKRPARAEHARTRAHAYKCARGSRTPGRMHTQQRKQNDTGHNASITHRSGYSASPAAACGTPLGVHSWVPLGTGTRNESMRAGDTMGRAVHLLDRKRRTQRQLYPRQDRGSAGPGADVGESVHTRTPTVAWLGRPLTVAVQRLHR
jgi:hypothetical protein